MTLVSDPDPLIEVHGAVSANICTESPAESMDDRPPLMVRETNTVQSEEVEVPVDKSPSRSHRNSQEKYIIPVQ